MTEKQAAYLAGLCEELGEPPLQGLSKAEAARQIKELRARVDENRRARPRDPASWVTGGEPMTDKQAELIARLCEDLGEPFQAGLTKAEATLRLEVLEHRVSQNRRKALARRDGPVPESATSTVTRVVSRLSAKREG